MWSVGYIISTDNTQDSCERERERGPSIQHVSEATCTAPVPILRTAGITDSMLLSFITRLISLQRDARQSSSEKHTTGLT